ncbi:MAG: polyphosphate kinase [Hydrotalea flava]|uniref:PPK2 family polyphosphate kinase n=1 Tax=Hydrotalea TaxID=1004300 RepID=UPI001C492397|nr:MULTISPECIES: PPK2 family polyphosphate kinase [Hydrotalea]MBY0349261.1 polyphosphate kinase [Hydrotalea flava]
MAKIRLAHLDTLPPKKTQKKKIIAETEKIIEELDELQNQLFAQSKHAVLVVIQGMDAAGKDGAIRHVFGKLNPQGVQVTSFKEPTALELSHDFLWRIHQHTPAKGMIHIFNRSHYEDVLVTRVHKMINNKLAYKRMDAINDFEHLLEEHNNTHILKFYLHISHGEQLKRLDERIKDPKKQWKYNEKDFEESKLWVEYMEVYEDCMNHCNKIPWIITPSDAHWYKEYMIASTLHQLLKDLKMQYPGLKK